jgi:hypothetical protein
MPSRARQGPTSTASDFAPLLAYLDRGRAPGDPLAGLLRPGNAPAGASDELIALVELALAQLPVT